MCGRFTLAKNPAEIAKRFKVNSVALQEFQASFNIPPTAKVPIIIQTPKVRRLETAQWGIARPWAGQITILQEEKVLKGTFKGLLARQRCIVPVDGFYEWGIRDKKKYPVWFSLKSGDLFGFPGIYDGGEMKRFTIFTTAPNSVVSKVNDRMPVILLPENEDHWLDPTVSDPAKLHKLLTQYPAGEMTSHEVSTAVSYAKNNSPDLIKPISR